MNIRDKFRKRWLGELGYTGGDPNLVGQPIILSKTDQTENSQTQQHAVRDKVYKPGTPPPRRKRTLNG